MTLHFQDPKLKNGRLLVDEIVDGLVDNRFNSWVGAYAFGSASGALATLEDDSFKEFVDRGGHAELIIGIDAVTNVAALEKLRQLQSPNLVVRVFKSSLASSLFHPKVSIFSGTSARLVIGSGNFTLGGLRKNLEAFVTLDANPGDSEQWASEWDGFVSRNLDNISEIDDEAIERARVNAELWKAARAAAKKVAKAAGGGGESEYRVIEVDEGSLALVEAAALNASRRALVAEVPINRWGQVQFDRATAEEFFGLTPGSAVRVLLEGVDEHGEAQMPETRKLVYSAANANPKVEFSTRRDLVYPPDWESVGRPILVVREDSTRSYAYSLFMPTDSEYGELADFLHLVPDHRGTRRLVTVWGDVLDVAPKAAGRISSQSP